MTTCPSFSLPLCPPPPLPYHPCLQEISIKPRKSQARVERVIDLYGGLGYASVEFVPLLAASVPYYIFVVVVVFGIDTSR